MRILLAWIAIGWLCGSPSLSYAQTDDWAAVEALPKETRVRIHEPGGKGWAFADGKLLLVKDDQITILKGGRTFVIPKTSIERVEQKRSDPVWNGVLIGLLYAIAMDLAYRDDSWTPWQTLNHYAGSIGACTFIDWRVEGKRTVYRAPQASMTLLRLRF